MDLWQVLKQSPWWVQFLFWVGQIASAYAAIVLLLPAIFGGCKMIKEKVAKMARIIKDYIVWKQYKPLIILLSPPSKIEKNLGQNTDTWSSQFIIQLQTRDNRVVQINLSEAKLLVLQGKGLRASKNELKIKTEGSYNFELSPSGQGAIAEKTIIVEAVILHSDLISSIITEKPFQWEIRNINARVHPLQFRNLKVIKGCSK